MHLPWDLSDVFLVIVWGCGFWRREQCTFLTAAVMMPSCVDVPLLIHSLAEGHRDYLFEAVMEKATPNINKISAEHCSMDWRSPLYLFAVSPAPLPSPGQF
ncbi:rCG37192 [Rattus norvegicus]|uniref:RCG37192 n=1 Tax=Rattus norvegicus TaxID=10116 RepID=A6HTW0_RAT|nr:rCG37192 [Rattus norvegicus]